MDHKGSRRLAPQTGLPVPLPLSCVTALYCLFTICCVLDAPAAHAGVLFSGQLEKTWQPYASAGGNFQQFAHTGPDGLKVVVPKGHDWGKTGIISREAVLQRDFRRVQVLTLDFDPNADDRYVISLIPEYAQAGDEWSTHTARVGLMGGDDGHYYLGLWINRKEMARTQVDPKTLSRIEILRHPDGAILVRGAGQQKLLQGRLKDEAVATAFRVAVLAHPTNANEAARMTLRRIAIRQEESATAANAMPRLLFDKPQQLALFEKGQLDHRWEKYWAQGGDFARHAQLAEDALHVKVPTGSNRGMVGIQSPEPVVWLDRFGPGAEETLVLRFDPAHTTGFVIVLCLDRVLNGNGPGWPALTLHWRRTADGKGRVSLRRDTEREPVFERDLPAEAPAALVIRLTPAGVRYEAPGFPPEPVAWNELQEGTGLRVMVFSDPDQANQPVEMTLRSIRLLRKPGALRREPRPAPGVQPLPVKVFFDGKAGDWFEPAAVRLDAAQCARYEDGRLVARVKAGATWWGKCGLISSRPLEDQFDRRLYRTPYRLTWQFDPAATSGVQIMFAGGKQAEMWPHKFLYLSLIREDLGPHTGDYRLTVEGNAEATRWLSGDWMEKHWDGRLFLEGLGDQWLRVGIPGGPMLRDHGSRFSQPAYMTVYAHPSYERGGARMALERITGQWVTPDGMTDAERWYFIDDDVFDPAAFLKEVAE